MVLIVIVLVFLLDCLCMFRLFLFGVWSLLCSAICLVVCSVAGLFVAGCCWLLYCWLGVLIWLRCFLPYGIWLVCLGLLIVLH